MKIEKLGRRNIYALLIVACCFSGLAFGQIKRNKKTTLVLNIQHFVGNQKLQMDSINYNNNLDQQFTITKFKYYISNICLKNKNGDVFQTNHVFLVDEEDSLSKTIELKDVPFDEYASIHFVIGVDSSRNCSGAQSGTLDPINGMFWTWNTGYIFMKFEGRSSSSSAPDGLLEYHIGGYKEPVNTIRSVSLPFNSPLNLSSNKNKIIEIKADILELLKTPTDIDFNRTPIITGIENAVLMSDNYMDMFKLINHEKN